MVLGLKLYFTAEKETPLKKPVLQIQLIDGESNGVVKESLHGIADRSLGFKVSYDGLTPDTAYKFIYWDPDMPEVKFQGGF